jgi:hypothetical protein
MELTSFRLLATAGATTVAAVVGLAFAWRHLTRYLLPVRVAAILICETLLVLTIALAINRAGGFYPTWSALTAPPPPFAVAGPAAAATASLRPQLQAMVPDGGHQGLIFRWPGAGQPHDPDPQPTVWLPPAYFQQPDLILPVAVVVVPSAATAASGAWNGNDVAPLVAAASGCVIFLRLGHGADSVRFASAVLPQLARSVGVADHAWGIVAVGSATDLGRSLFSADTLRFTSFASVAARPGLLATAVVRAFAGLPPALSPPVTQPPAPISPLPPVPSPAPTRADPVTAPLATGAA